MASIELSGFHAETETNNRPAGNALKTWWAGFRRTRAEAATLRKLQTMTAYELADLGFEAEAVYAAGPHDFRTLRRDTSGVAA